MKKLFSIMSVILFAGTLVRAEEFANDVNFKARVNLDTGAILSIVGTKVTATAAQLNAAGGGSTATLTPTLITNNTLKVYGSNLVIKAGGTVDVPAGSVAAASIAAGTMANTMIISNTLSQYVGTNVDIVAGGRLTIGTGGTVTVPAGSVAAASIAAGTLSGAMTLGSTLTGTNGMTRNGDGVLSGYSTGHTNYHMMVWADNVADGDVDFPQAAKNSNVLMMFQWNDVGLAGYSSSNLTVRSYTTTATNAILSSDIITAGAGTNITCWAWCEQL